MTPAGINKRVYPHLLRHSWMTEMLRNGMNPIQLSIIAGASVEVISGGTDTHLNKGDAYEAMIERWGHGTKAIGPTVPVACRWRQGQPSAVGSPAES